MGLIIKKNTLYLKLYFRWIVIFICKLWRPYSRWHWYTNLEPVGLQQVPSQQELWAGKSLKFFHWNLEGRWEEVEWDLEQGPPAWSPCLTQFGSSITLCVQLIHLPKRGPGGHSLAICRGVLDLVEQMLGIRTGLGKSLKMSLSDSISSSLKWALGIPWWSSG